MKIVLLGYMGSGKSTIGQHLAKKLGISFLDLDDYIIEQEGMEISAIFKAKGELYFRKKEAFYLDEVLSKKNNFILSLGGGTPCYGINITIINSKTAQAFYLQVSVPELTKRLSSEKEHRPLIAQIADEDLPEFIGKHLFERRQFYEQVTHTIACTGKTVPEILSLIEKKLV